MLESVLARIGMNPTIPNNRAGVLREMAANRRALAEARAIRREYWEPDCQDEDNAKIASIHSRGVALAAGALFLRSKRRIAKLAGRIMGAQ